MSLYIGPELTGDQFLALRDIADHHENARRVKIVRAGKAIIVEIRGAEEADYLLGVDGTIHVGEDAEWVKAPDQFMRS